MPQPKDTQHNTSRMVPSEGARLDELRRGNATLLNSIEFDLHAAQQPDGSFQLMVGHPLDVLQKKVEPIPVQDYLRFLTEGKKASLLPGRIVIDVKAKGFKSGFGPIHTPGELNALKEGLPGIIHQLQQAGQYLADAGHPIEIVIGSTFDYLFQPESTTALTPDVHKEAVAFSEQLTALKQERIKTLYFPRFENEPDVFVKALKLGVDMVGPNMDFKKPEEYLIRIKELLNTHPEYQKFAASLSFNIIDDPKLVALIRAHFPEADIWTNESGIIEQEEKRIRRERQNASLR